MKTKSLRNLILIAMVFAMPSCLSVSESELNTAGSSSNASLLKPIAASYNRTCVLSQEGGVKCWGHNDEGELGQGDKVARGANVGDMTNMPFIDLGTGRSAKSVAVADWHVCAILDNDKVKCWGWNGNGELGYGDTTDRGDDPNEMGDNLPYVDLGTNRKAKAISAAGSHTCVILDNNTLKCWGYNQDGELGYEDLNHRGDAASEMGDDLPVVNLGTGRTAKYVTVAGHHTCAILDNDKVKCWGHNGFGSLGVGHSDGRGHNTGHMGDNLEYADLGTGRTAKILVSAGFANCAILDNDKVKCWGRNHVGQLGLGDKNDRGDEPNEMGDNLPYVDLGTNMKADVLSANSQHICTLLKNDKVKCWGWNSGGGSNLGIGDSLDRGDDANEMGDNLPFLDFGTGKKAKVIAAGHEHSCVILNDYSVKCWGNNWLGQLGTEDTESRGDQPNEMGDNLPETILNF